MDEMLDGFAWIGTAGFGAEVGAAAEGAVFVDGATVIAAEQGTATGLAVSAVRESFSSHRAYSVSCDEGLAGSEHRRFSGQSKVAASGSRDAIAGDVELFNIGVHRTRFENRFVFGHVFTLRFSARCDSCSSKSKI
jgi:hypothetical protein